MVVGRLELPGVTGASGGSGGPEEATVSPGHKHTAEREALGLGLGLGPGSCVWSRSRSGSGSGSCVWVWSRSGSWSGSCVWFWSRSVPVLLPVLVASMPFWWTGTLFSILNLLDGGSILEFWRQTDFSYKLTTGQTSPAPSARPPPTSMYRTFLLVRLVLGEAPGRTFILLTSSRIPRDLATWNTSRQVHDWQPVSGHRRTTARLSSLPPPRTRTRTRSHLDVADLQGQRPHLGAHDVVLGRLAHSALQRLELPVDVWEAGPSRSVALHLGGRGKESTDSTSCHRVTDVIITVLTREAE